MTRQKFITYAAAAAAMGPISGPLALRAAYHWKNGAHFLAWLYVVVTAMCWFYLPAAIITVWSYVFRHL